MRPALLVCVGLCTWMFGSLVGCTGTDKPTEFPRSSASAQQTSDAYRSLLARYTDAEGVDYARWQKDAQAVAALDAYLGAVTRVTPTTHPKEFDTEQARLAYWIDLYNALVIREVVRRWPIKSVRDIRPDGTSSLIPGKGFFAGLRFTVGGNAISLDAIEHKIIRSQFKDARIHFAINCGSASCPVLGKTTYADQDLDAELDRATRRFINQRENVQVDNKKRRVVISKIFKWYGSDFVRSARSLLNSPSANVVDFIAYYADPTLKTALAAARAQRYTVTYRTYDWSVNHRTGAASLDAPASFEVGRESRTGVGQPMPAVSLPLLGGGTWRSSDARGKVLLIDIWATYCKPCRKSLPELAALAEKFAGEVEIITIAVDESPHQIGDFLAELAVTLPVAHDPEQARTGTALSIRRLPTTIVVDGDGIVRRRVEGASNARDLIDSLLSPSQ